MIFKVFDIVLYESLVFKLGRDNLVTLRETYMKPKNPNMLMHKELCPCESGKH